MSEGDPWLARTAQDIQYPVADLGGDLVWAADPSSPLGRPSGLVCAGCGEPMIARLGTKCRPHFGHRPGSTCSGGETALHRTAIDRYHPWMIVRKSTGNLRMGVNPGYFKSQDPATVASIVTAS